MEEDEARSLAAPNHTPPRTSRSTVMDGFVNGGGDNGDSDNGGYDTGGGDNGDGDDGECDNDGGDNGDGDDGGCDNGGDKSNLTNDNIDDIVEMFNDAATSDGSSSDEDYTASVSTDQSPKRKSIAQTECACKNKLCNKPVDVNILDSLHRCHQCGLKISGLCLTETEQTNPSTIKCKFCTEESPMDVSSVTDKSAVSKSSTDSWYDPALSNVVDLEEIISPRFTYHNTLVLPDKTQLSSMQYVRVKGYPLRRFLFVGVIVEKSKKKKKHLAYDTLDKTLHHTFISYLSEDSSADLPSSVVVEAESSLQQLTKTLSDSRVLTFPQLPAMSSVCGAYSTGNSCTFTSCLLIIFIMYLQCHWRRGQCMTPRSTQRSRT